MARSFSQEPRSDSHKIGETRYRMSHLPSSTAIVRAALFAGVLLAILLLPVRSHDPVHAQAVTETEIIEYAEDRTDEVVAYTANDPEKEDISWTKGGTDADDFDLEDGVLTFKNQPDYETTASYTVSVIASDGNAANDHTRELTINIINVDEPGTVMLSTVQPLQNTQLTATLSDDDSVTASTVKWRWATSTSPRGPWTNIKRLASASGGARTSNYTPVKADEGFYLRATATYNDGHGDDKIKSGVSDNPVRKNLINDAPQFVYVEGDDIPDANGEDNDEVGEPIPDSDTAVDRELQENSPAGTNVGPRVKAIDEDGDTLTYVLGGTDVGSFDIDRQSGQISVKAGTTLNREAKTTYTVTVTARDPSHTTGSPSMDTIEVTITLIDVPEAPEITGGDTSIDYDENTPVTTAVDTYTATDDEDDSRTPQVALEWSLSGTDSDMFAISAAGALTFEEMPDYEALSNTQKSNGLKVTVTVTDSADMTDSRNVTVNVTNVDEPGTVTLSRVQPQVGTSISASVTDLDGRPSGITWKWATSTTQGTPGPFIQGRTSSSYTPVAGDLGSNNVYLWAFASYTDPQGSGKSARTESAYVVKLKNTYCVRIHSTDTTRCTSTRDGNVRPMFPDQDTQTTGDQRDKTTREIAENTAAGQNITLGITGGLTGAVAAEADDQNIVSADPGAPLSTTTATDNLTYTLEGTDSSSFDIASTTGQLMTKAPLDFETKKSYSVRVKATDPTGSNATINVTINVTDVAEAPKITNGDTEASVSENVPATRILSIYTATDDEDDYDDPSDDSNEIVPLKWSLSGTDEDDFELSAETGASTNLMFKASPNYENPTDGDTNNEYSVTVTVTDSAGTTDATNANTVTLTVTVINEDEEGTVTLSVEQPKVGIELTATLTDPDGSPGDGLPLEIADFNLTAETDTSWQWARSTSRTGSWTDIKGETSNTYTPDADDDVGYFLRATATYNDRLGQDKTEPGVSSYSVEAATYTNTAPVFVYVEGDEISDYPYPDFDNDGTPDDLDSDGNVDDYDVGDKIPDVNGASLGVTRKVAENSTAGTTVGAPVFAKDLGRNGTQENLTYQLVDPTPTANTSPEDLFTIDRQTGQIRVKAGTMLNREVADPTYTVTVLAKDPSDQGDAADPADQSRDTIEVTIRVTDVPEAPKITGGDTATSTPESIPGTPARTVLDTYTATDDEDNYDDPNDNTNEVVPLKWSLSGTDSDMFEISAAGALTFEEMPDYEALSNAQKSNGLKLTVTVTDSADMTDSRNVTVTVTNVDEAGTVTLSRVQPQVGTSISASVTDLDGRPSGVTWKWATSTGDTAPGPFIQGRTSSSYTPVAGDFSTYLWAVASYTDPQGSTKTARIVSANTVKLKNTYCIRVDTNDPTRCTSTRDGNVRPMFPDQDTQTTGDQRDRTTREIAENTAAGVNITSGVTGGLTGAVAAEADDDNIVSADPSAPLSTSTATDNLTYTLEGTDASSFDIASTTGQLITKAPLDFETKKSYSVRVKATDPTGSNATINVTINVTDVDEAPRVSKKSLLITGSSSHSYPETETSRQVATYTAEGPEGTRAWRLSGDDAGDLSISSGGVLSFRSQPDFENPADSDTDNVYRVTVEASVSGTVLVDSMDVMVTVTNVDEPGSVTITSLNAVVRVGVELTAELDEGDEETVVGWQWSSGASVTGPWSDISGERNNTYTPVPGDVGSYLRATVTYNDPLGSGKTLSEVAGTAVEAASAGTPGTVSLSPPGGLVSGNSVTASLTDPDNPVSLNWTWEISADGSTNWSTAPGVASSSGLTSTYTTTIVEVGNFLRASVTYNDDTGSGETAGPTATTDAVQAGTQQGHRYDLNSNGSIERDEVLAAITDFLFNETPPGGGPATTRDEVLELIALFLFP